ncbi:MAG: ATP-binding protein [Neisseria sp.]|uniref:ATP-binding protein n=1 Tax=Neisseria sp. TaxID=192066 RepID=UPI0026DCA11B|nr:ATP-binding protein [Neisseria sp.]MDO4641592.1 ATP-binding protein [Neisseria sp.]
MDKTRNVTGLEKLQGSSTKRYRKVTISVAVFLVFISGVMIVNSQISQQIQVNQVQIDAAGTLSDTAYDIVTATQALQILTLEKHDEKKHRAEKNETAYQAKLQENDAESMELQKKLEKSRHQFQEIITALDKGGHYTIVEGHNFLQPLSAEGTREALAKVQGIWKDYQPLIHKVVKYKVTSNENPNFAQEVSEFTHDNYQDIYENIDDIIVSINNDMNKKAVLMQRIQITGITLSLLYFLLFIGLFMRRLGKADQAAAAARNETKEILQTVSSGLFLLDRNLNIGSQYSAELERLLGKKNLAGKNLLDLLSDMVANARDLDTAGSFVQQLYNPRTKERLIASLNPLVRCPVNMINDSGEKEIRYFDFKFNRVYHEDSIARVLVNVNDVTHAVLLEDKIEAEREQNDLRMEMLNTILKTDSQLLSDFITHTKTRNENINGILKEPVQGQSEFSDKARRIFREVHGMKGDASSLNLQGFVSLAEVLETLLKDLQRKTTLVGEDFLPLTVSLEELFSLTEVIEDLNNRIAGNGGDSARHVFNSEPIKEQLSKFVKGLAERNGKQVDFSCTGMDNTPLNVNVKSHLNEMAIQMLRNAVVHGIEPPEDRLNKHKLAAGHLRLDLEETSNGSIKLTVQDDGTGIDHEKIRRKLIENGTYSQEQAARLDTKELVQQIFEHGFSTASNNTEDAGRGIGMDIIKERVQQLGGKVALATKIGAYTRIVLTIPKKL